MTTYKTGKGFTMVELLIVVAILAILSSVAYIGIQRARVNVMNTKVAVDLSAIENAMEQYKRDHEGKYPIPTPGADKNLNCFYLDTAYAHDCSNADFIQSQIDNTLLTKRYLQEVPTDPRTGARYAYSATADGQYYQIAGLIENDDGTYSAKVAGNLHFTYPLKSLIRSYNSPEFVMDGEGHLPYSPDHLAMTATIQSITGTVEVDAKPASDGDTISPGSVITTAPASSAVLYFSDGSITYLDPGTTLRLLPNSEVKKNDKDGIITKIRLKLLQGKIWNKVIRLASESEFNIETTSAIAGVRGTEFGMDAAGNKITVLSGTVVARMLAPGEIPATTDQFFYFNSSTTYFTDSTNQEAKGTGTGFQEFDIGNVSSVTTVTAPTLLNGLKSKYYTQPYSNALQPRILEIDIPSNILSLQLIQKAANSPFPFPEPDEVLAFDENSPSSSPLASWTSAFSDFTIDYVNGTVDISVPAATALFAANPNKPVTFAFKDKEGNLTAKSSPAVTLKSGTHATYAMFYGDETPKKTKMATAPSITAFPASLKLGSPPATLAADKPCDWKIQNGGGKLMGTVNNIANVSYVSIDPGLTVTGLITDIGSRFNSTANDAVTVRCSDPGNPGSYDEKSFMVAYEPWLISPAPPAGSGYKYSYLAGKKNWTDAKNACANLKEGGFIWSLPGIGNSAGGIDIADGTINNNKTSTAEIALTCANTGTVCTDTIFGSAGAVWLLDDIGAQAYTVAIVDQKFYTLNKALQFAFRCVTP
ncbi:FecR domain-containing protein [Patescibacteria group bacterium]|nr:FecR domain-containing protein [Patescibacteria group bacterium]